MPASDVCLYANWSPATYTVTFDSGGSEMLSQLDAERGTAATEPTPPTKDGF